MPILNEHHGGYDHRNMIEVFGSFLVNGTSTPDGLRDGKTNAFTVAYSSAGLFTVTLTGSHPLPLRNVIEMATISPVDTSAVLVCTAGVVEGSWSSITRTFQILCTLVGDTGASAYFDPAPSNPDDNCRISFFLKGSLSSAGTDAA